MEVEEVVVVDTEEIAMVVVVEAVVVMVEVAMVEEVVDMVVVVVDTVVVVATVVEEAVVEDMDGVNSFTVSGKIFMCFC